MSRLDGARSTISMWHEGEYSTHTQGAKDAIDNARDLACGAILEMDVAGAGAPFHIADYGAADGGTSMDLHRATIAALRERAPRRTVCITYTDLPGNDYSALFTTANGGRSGVTSYRDEHADIFVYAAATSFFEPIFPPGTIDFGFSATAMHWLSALPCPVSGHVHMAGAHGEELETLRARARADWRDILLARASELKPGGRLMTVNLALADDGRHMGNTGGANMFDVMNRLWRALADDGTITDAEYRRTTIPQFYRTPAELHAPLLDSGGPVHRAGLRLVHAETRFTRCPYAARFAEDGDAERFASAYVPNTRTWSETVFVNALDVARPPAQRRAIVERYFRSFADLVRADPEPHAMDYIHECMVMEKVRAGGEQVRRGAVGEEPARQESA